MLVVLSQSTTGTCWHENSHCNMLRCISTNSVMQAWQCRIHGSCRWLVMLQRTGARVVRHVT